MNIDSPWEDPRVDWHVPEIELGPDQESFRATLSYERPFLASLATGKE